MRQQIDPSRQNRTLVVFTGRYAANAVAEHIEAVARTFPHWDLHVIQESAPQSTFRYLASKLRQLRRQPLSYLLEVAAKVATGLPRAFTALTRRPPVRYPAFVRTVGSVHEIDVPNTTYHACRYLHDAETIDLIRSFKPWLGISIGAPILREKLFSVPELGTINIHKSLLPNYRGMPPGFWEIHDGAECTGVSIHWVAKKLDAGDLILQRELSVPRYATPGGLAVQLDVLGTDVLLEALKEIEHGSPRRLSLETAQSQLRRQPSWLTERSVVRKTWKRRRPSSLAQSLRNVAKGIVLAAYAFVWAPLRNVVLSLQGKCHVSMLLYHRVDDQFLDDVTVGIEQFDRQLEILKQKYEVLDLATFLASQGKRRKRPAVVITFDDGYACNYLAAVLLRRHGLPATFFVSTGMIGTEKPFPHDMESLGYRVPALDWSQVKQMAKWGYTFGVHTANHARLSALSVDEALAEVRQAQDDLKDRSNGQALTDCLAYPYGKRSDMSEEVRESLHQVGIRYCFSAFGGVNVPTWQPLDILRAGVDARFTDLGFLAVLEGWRVSER